MIGLNKFGNKTANIKCKKLISLQHRVRVMKSHIQNSTNHQSAPVIIPEKNDLCCFGCVTSSLLHGVVN